LVGWHDPWVFSGAAPQEDWDTFETYCQLAGLYLVSKLKHLPHYLGGKTDKAFWKN
jgi:hypothetical protein